MGVVAVAVGGGGGGGPDQFYGSALVKLYNTLSFIVLGVYAIKTTFLSHDRKDLVNLRSNDSS